MKDLQQILKQYWGFDKFRPLQEDIIQSVLDKKDTLALLPTGGGKSVCFQVPALAMDGICIVVTPLIALMKDQVEQLKKRGIPAVAVFSGLNYKEIDIALDNCIYGNMKFLYLSPERLKTEILLERAKKMKVNLLAIDEAHCISQWGYDFRPAYLQIANFREVLPPGVPLIALTATATDRVKKDIQEKLLFNSEAVYQQSFFRNNLSYSCFLEQDKERKLLKVLNNVKGSGLVYVRSRKHAEEISYLLNKNKIRADFYHAGLSNQVRFSKQSAWINNEIRIMVATNAFGMGIDKADVRVVAHIDLPENPESYYQEAGRAGRDGMKSYCVVIYNENNIESLKKKFEESYPSVDFIRRVYQSLANYFKIAVGSSNMASYDFDLEEFQRIYKLSKKSTYYALKRLEMEGFILLNESFYNPSRVYFKVDNKNLYDFQLRNESYDEFIKTILRMYGGELFSNFIQVIEKNISKQLRIPEAEVIKKFQYLQNMNLIIYEQKKEMPQITFTTERYDAIKLPINIKVLEERMRNDKGKMEAVVHYISQDKRCRSLVLTDYFGEKSDKECEICDICLEKRKHIDLNKENSYRSRIIQSLQLKNLSLEQIVPMIDPKKEKEVLRTIKEMLDANELVYDEKGWIKIYNSNNN